MTQSLLLRFGELVIDLARYRVVLSGRALPLRYREYALLVYLAGRAGQVVHRGGSSWKKGWGCMIRAGVAG